MTLQDEVVKTYNMIKNADFQLMDIMFEGVISVKNKELLSKIEELSESKKAIGTMKIVYTSGENQIRTIEIPVGLPLPELRDELPTI